MNNLNDEQLNRLYDRIEQLEKENEALKKHGKWICMDEKKQIWGCSRCHMLAAYPSPYCPNCGAKMKWGNCNDND